MRLRDLHGNDRRQTLAQVVAGGGLVLVLDQLGVAGVGVHTPRQSRTEAGKVGAAFDRVDVVGEGEDGFVVAVVILHHQFQRELGLRILLADQDGAVHGLLAVVEVLHECDQPLVELEGLLLIVALVDQADPQTFVEVRQLPQTRREDLVAQASVGEDFRIWHEADLRAGFLPLADLLQLPVLLAAAELHEIDVALAGNLNLHPLRQGVDHRRAHPVESAGDLVAVVIELAAGVQPAHHYFQRGNLQPRMGPHGDAHAVVDDRARPVRVDPHCDVLAPPGHGLVDGIVDQFPHQVVQPARGGVADVHPGTLPHGLQALEDLDLGFVVNGCLAGLVLGHLRAPFDKPNVALGDAVPTHRFR